MSGENEMEDDPKCQVCGSEMKRSWTTEDYLFWVCLGPDQHQEMEWFGDMSDESWEWIKQDMRAQAKRREEKKLISG